MRKLIATISFLLCLQATAVLAQPYQTIFADNGATEWVFIWQNFAGWTNDTAYVEKDTVVNGISYKKVIRTFKASHNPTLIREDVNTGQVWFRNLINCPGPDDTTERLAFDFSVGVGDTFDMGHPFLFNYSDSCKIVDSVRYIHGLKYIYFRCRYNPYYDEPFTMIEGIGSNWGILTKICTDDDIMAKRYLLCSYKNGQKTTYENKDFNGICWQYNALEDVSIKEIVTIYPQPAYSKVNIDNSTNQRINKVEIISNIGTIVLEISNPVITQLDISNIPAGYYLLKLYTSTGYVTTKPLLITK